MKKITKRIYALISLVCFQLLPGFSSIITFNKVYPTPIDQSTRDVVSTTDGGYLIAGMTTNKIPGDSDIYLVKTNYAGDTLWTKKYGGNKPDYPYTIIGTGDGNYFIIGYTASYGAGSYDTWLLKINPSGDTLWTKTYGSARDEQAKNITQTSDGNYIIVGRANTPNISNYDAFLMKITPAGVVIWTKYYGGSGYETGHSVQLCQDNGFIFVGATYSFGSGGEDIYLVKTNASGDTLWTKTFGGTGDDEGDGILANNDGSYTFVAETNSIGAGDWDIQMIKTNYKGDILWNKTYGGNKKDVAHMVQPAAGNGYIISGISRSFGWINPDMWLVRTNSSGDTLWTRHFGSWYHDHCYATKQTGDGGFISVGHSEDINSITHIMFVKVDSSGNMNNLSVNENMLSNLNIYPNPTNGAIHLDLKSVGAPSEITVTTITGTILYSAKSDFSPEVPIDLTGENPGVYFVNISTNNKSSTRKIILE